MHCVGDIWSENGISLFAVLIHFTDSKWEYHARLAICKGRSDSAHTGEVISEITNKGLLDIGLGDDDTLVQDCIHSCTPNEGSNMLKGWKDFEGARCVCYRQQNCLGTCLDIRDIKSIISKIKGIHKVMHYVFETAFVIL